ncbi:hypothetical protein AAFF_G00312740 [Aldrovandia affinis]|uniref:Uncharacterized protein n=1 Tax=Aldrovandia affinis TaxID=143900 RepID=A0AAD7WQS6_9TELE|nr:hypothetical protein AAFF_G00312740 [Aldrovandia affinis]
MSPCSCASARQLQRDSDTKHNMERLAVYIPALLEPWQFCESVIFEWTGPRCSWDGLPDRSHHFQFRALSA